MILYLGADFVHGLAGRLCFVKKLVDSKEILVVSLLLELHRSVTRLSAGRRIRSRKLLVDSVARMLQSLGDV